MKPIYTVKEVCGLLKVSQMTIYRLIAGGLLKATKIGKTNLVRIREQDVERFLKGKGGVL